MRAIYYPFSKENLNNSIVVTAESAKHLNVIRIKTAEDVLVLNGCGLKAYTKVGVIAKNSIELLIVSIEEATPLHNINLAIANPKKDAFEDILKLAVELGIQNIYPLSSEFSQYEYIQSERVQRILESALIQSNNPFMLVVHPEQKLSTFLDNLKLPLYFFNSKPNNCGKGEKILEEKIVLIGPEGGFSDREVEEILARKKIYSIHLATPIQRAPTAVASSIGYLLSLCAT